MEWTKLPGVLGTALVIIAYLPQIYHLITEGCSAGISIRAYTLWSASAILILIHAISINAAIFIGLQVFQLVATAVIMFCALKYRHGVCSVYKKNLMQHAAQYRVL